jgi:hypothetical protein
VLNISRMKWGRALALESDMSKHAEEDSGGRAHVSCVDVSLGGTAHAVRTFSYGRLRLDSQRAGDRKPVTAARSASAWGVIGRQPIDGLRRRRAGPRTHSPSLSLFLFLFLSLYNNSAAGTVSDAFRS